MLINKSSKKPQNACYFSKKLFLLHISFEPRKLTKFENTFAAVKYISNDELDCFTNFQKRQCFVYIHVIHFYDLIASVV